MNLTVPEVLPLFPLPETVLLPHTRLPLLVFEPRYRDLIQDIRDGEGWLAVPMLNAKASREAGGPVLHEIAGAGRLSECRDVPGGRFQIVVEGRARVRLVEIEVSTAYRQARALPHPEDPSWLWREEAGTLLEDAWSLAEALHLLTDGEPRTLLEDPEARPILINRLASMVMATGEERQALLEAPGYEGRLKLLLRQLKVGLSLADSLARHPRPDDPALN